MTDIPQEYKKLFKTLSVDDRAYLRSACNNAQMVARRFNPAYCSSAVSFEDAYYELKGLEPRIENKRAYALVTRDIADILLKLMAATNKQEAEEILQPVRAMEHYLLRGIKDDAEAKVAQNLHTLRNEADKLYKKD